MALSGSIGHETVTPSMKEYGKDTFCIGKFNLI